MLSLDKVRAIEVLLAQGRLSQREIARRVRVNRETVNRIASGQRVDYVRLRRWRTRHEPRQLFSAIRCRMCGAKIRVLPCQRCHLHWLIATGAVKRNRTGNDTALPLGVELTGDYLRRYLLILAAKIRQGEEPLDDVNLAFGLQVVGTNQLAD